MTVFLWSFDVFTCPSASGPFLLPYLLRPLVGRRPHIPNDEGLRHLVWANWHELSLSAPNTFSLDAIRDWLGNSSTLCRLWRQVSAWPDLPDCSKGQQPQYGSKLTHRFFRVQSKPYTACSCTLAHGHREHTYKPPPQSYWLHVISDICARVNLSR